ncbi:hypothetical protein ONZ45_g1562 [Pleurotus djamor]|nr:hypothetical protein ONZ45_g1562 [Pleurotus djamor]
MAKSPSPFGHFVEVALREANLQYTRYEIDLKNDKPSWIFDINHIGKVPTITYGGPPVPPEQPSPESFKLAESIAILEFINEIAPDAKLLPATPKERAKTRSCMQFVMTRVQPIFYQALMRQGSMRDIIQVLKELQYFLPEVPAEGEETTKKFVGGESFSLGDAVVSAWVVRMNFFLGNDIGSWPEGEGVKLQEEILSSEELVKFQSYRKTLLSRPAVTETFSQVCLV